MRITGHPVLQFSRGKKIKFYFEGEEIEGYAGETIAAALHAAGVKDYHYSPKLNRPRGFFCAIGNCSSCLMEVDGQPNVRVCTEQVSEGMKVRRQHNKGVLKP